MGLFDLIRRDDKIDYIDRRLSLSFQKVQDSFLKINQWIQYLSNKDGYQDLKLHELEKELQRQGLSKDKIRDIIQAKYQYHYILEKVKDIDDIRHENALLKAKVTELEEMRKEYFRIVQKTHEIDVLREYYSFVAAKIKEMEEKIEKKAVQKPSLRERIIRRFTHNSKEHTKNFILNLIRKYEEISALQLRDIVVEEQGVCSKSSFYRALEEIEESGDAFVERKGKEKHYRAIRVMQ